jgi:cell division protein FtsN
VEHTTTANGMANGIRQGYTGGLVLSQLHIGLAVGFTLVACLTAFGGGVIVGMWYKASEQSAPLSAAGPSPMAEQPAQSQEPVSQAPEPQAPVTFYKTLTNSNGAYAPLTLAPTPTISGTPTAASGATPTRGTPTGGAADSPKAVTPVKATTAVVPPAKTSSGTTRTVAVSESQKHPKAVSGSKVSPAEAVASAGSTKTAALSAAATTTAAQKPVASARQSGKDIGVQQPASAPAVGPAKTTSAEDFSVQVGSFGSSAQAERLRTSLAQKGYPARVQLSDVPGQGLRYRVRVGSYTDRTAADQTAHHLTAQEQVPAIVAGKD